MAFDHKTCRQVVMAPEHYQGLRAWWHREPRSRDREGSQAVFSSLTKVYLLQVHSSPAGGSHILPALLFAFIAGIDKDTPLEPEFLDLFQIYLWVSGTVPYSTFYHLCCSAEVSR